jgi:tetratricopeptide (TPR) repeat protein
VIAALLMLLLTQEPQDGSALYLRPVVTVEHIDGRPWYTVRAQNAAAEQILTELARLSDRELEGFEALSRSSLVTVDLERRPIEVVLEYTLGSIGLGYELRRDRITVSKDGFEIVGTEENLERASFAWVRAASRFPDHPEAAAARLAQGEISELRGLLGPARDHYLTLIERYPKSPFTAEAYMRAGRVSAQLGDWAGASRNFRTLANMATAPDYHAAARLEWAKAQIKLDDPEAALHMLSALEINYPPIDATDRTARLLVRARALSARGLYMEALQAIDGADGDLDPIGSWEALEIRALALDGIGLPGEAARAWLLYAEGASGVEQVLAFEHAARLSLEAGDELATLFVVRRAAILGADDGLARYATEARQRLGFMTIGPSDAQGVLARLDQAELWLENDELGRACSIFEALYLGRGALDELTKARVCVGWAHCVATQQGLEAAIGTLSEIRASLQSFEARRRLDLGTARLLEAHGFDERAIDAYEGRY